MMHRVAHERSVAELPVLIRDRWGEVQIVPTVLSSRPMRSIQFILDRRGLRVEPCPIVQKNLTDVLVRLMFPVVGGVIEDGAVVSIVCLFDRSANQTLYAHPMHAGPGINPLIKHPDGPMAAPKSQAGADGVRASRRIIEHKKALWDRFLQDRSALGQEEAGRRWREGYYWALKRLYFCSGCPRCKWGSPFFEVPDASLPPMASSGMPAAPREPLVGQQATLIGEILRSEAWEVEAAYARRGGFSVSPHPRLLKALDDEFVQVIFPTDALVLQGGALVAVAFTYHRPSRQVVLSHCLCAGPDLDIQFRKGDVAFGLPGPQPGSAGDEAKSTYQQWRRAAWSRFWLNDLERGPEAASAVWLQEFWDALEALFGGNELPVKGRPHLPGGTHESAEGGAEGHSRPVLPAEALENVGERCFSGHATNRVRSELRALGLSTLMVNLGRRCNQACHHCHIEAGPNRTEEMSRETVECVLGAIGRCGIETLDITGGAPEMNPHFRYLVQEAARLGCRVVDRCNLTIFFEPGYEDLPEFLAKHRIQVTASLPSDQAEVVDRQRGLGSFTKSIAALRKLNELGYGQPDSGLTLNLVFNPSGTDLGAPQEALERRFKRELLDRFGIVFDRLFSMNNMPINRFEHYLKREGLLSDYMSGLVGAFNPETTDGLMCRRTLSVGYDGRLFDCDFHQVMEVPLSHGLPAHIRDLDVAALESREINTRPHCFGCTAGAGSSCNGALTNRVFPEAARATRQRADRSRANADGTTVRGELA
ncbi:MAG: arsenosugar biosynthesis radical SAM (seleno)protein ArsS [Phycisphaerae bacterium]